MTFVDANVIIDIVADDPLWKTWSLDQLVRAASSGPVVVNAIVFAELCRGFSSAAALSDQLSSMEIELIPIDTATAFLAGKRFAAYRRSDDRARNPRVLPDFFIGAHASVLDMPLLTRDVKLHQAHFPELTLITPDTDDG